jgi:predicted DNA-binding transcriptional regulator AlpA
MAPALALSAPVGLPGVRERSVRVLAMIAPGADEVETVDNLLPVEGTTVDVVGQKEVADRLGVERQTVRQWAARGLLPPREFTVSGGPAWRWSTIQKWSEKTGHPKRNETEEP